MITDQDLIAIFKQKKKRKITNKRDGDAPEKFVAGFDSTTLEEFEHWLKNSNYDQGCYYCKTTAQQTFDLYTKAINGDGFNWTRGGKRGKRLEIDRRDPALSYDDLSNLVWCCYWCNNAKSNFFSEEQFKPIALAIGEALKKKM